MKAVASNDMTETTGPIGTKFELFGFPIFCF